MPDDVLLQGRIIMIIMIKKGKKNIRQRRYEKWKADSIRLLKNANGVGIAIFDVPDELSNISKINIFLRHYSFGLMSGIQSSSAGCSFNVSQ